MKTKDDYTPKALRAVYAWKDSVYRNTAGKEFSEVRSYFADGMKAAAQILSTSIVTNADGSYSFKR